jgi:hypothetical protein
VLSALGAHGEQEARECVSLSHGITKSCSQGDLLSAGRSQSLREEWEISNAEEQLYRLRRRVTLAQFYNDYTNAQADPPEFLYPKRK